MEDKLKFKSELEKSLLSSRVIIDRPKGSAHPRYSEYIYPLDYGYIEGTKSQDGGGIDVWCGSGNRKEVSGVLVIFDPVKKDSEIKVLIGCNEEESRAALECSNRGEMVAITIKLKEEK